MLGANEIYRHMIQYYLDLKNQSKAIQNAGLSGGQIQKIYSTAFYISMAIRTPGKTWHLYLGRGGGHEGVWLHDAAPPSVLRRKDNFLEYFRRHLSSCAFYDLDLDPSDRIIRLRYQKFKQYQYFLLFWRARKLYFIHYYQEAYGTPFRLLLSWRGKAFIPPEEVTDLYELFNEVGRRDDMDHDLSSPKIASMEELLQVELKSSSLKSASNIPQFLLRKKDNIENDLRKARQWERLQSMLDRGMPLDGHEIKVGDHKIKFEGQLNPYERRNVIFQKIKKLKRGENILSDRLQQVKEQLEGKEEVKLETSTVPMVKPVWGKDEATTIIHPLKPEQNFKIIKTPTYQIGIGLSSQGNDQLRAKWANKDDFWFHLDGQKSAHVVVKLTGTSGLDTETINLAASILAYFSHFNGDWIPVIYTQVKNLKGVTGAPGMVTYKKEKHLNCPRIDISHCLKE